MNIGDELEGVRVTGKYGGEVSVYLLETPEGPRAIKIGPLNGIREFEFDVGDCESIVRVLKRWTFGDQVALMFPAYNPILVEAPDLYVVAIEMAKALEHLRKLCVVHNDLRPDNIVYRDGDPSFPVLIDFGSMTQHGGLCRGSFGDRTIGLAASTASDVQLLGGCLYEMATGISPLKLHEDWLPALLGPPPQWIAPHMFPPVKLENVRALPRIERAIPGALGPLVRKMLSYDPSARPTPLQIIDILKTPRPNCADSSDDEWSKYKIYDGLVRSETVDQHNRA